MQYLNFPKSLTFASQTGQNRDQNITMQPRFAGSGPVFTPETPHLWRKMSSFSLPQNLT
jgi:hypothetical protein